MPSTENENGSEPTMLTPSPGVHFILIDSPRLTANGGLRLSDESGNETQSDVEDTLNFRNAEEPRIAGIQPIWRYESFWSALADDRGLQSLDSSGIEYSIRDEVFTIGRGSLFFDYRNGAPDVLPALRLQARGSDELYLLGLLGPVVDEWLIDFREQGTTVLFPVSRNTYLARFPLGVADNLRTRPYVGWVEPYHYAFRMTPETATTVLSGLSEEAEINVSVNLIHKVCQSADADAACTALTPRSWEETETTTVLGRFSGRFSETVIARVPSSRLSEILLNPDVEWIQPISFEGTWYNADASAIVQSGQTGSWPVFAHGITGAWDPQIVAFLDAGLDVGHEMFDDPLHPFNDACVPMPDHRKIYAYCLLPGGVLGDEIPHGTAVGGIVAGDAPNWGVRSNQDGNVFGGRLVVQDVCHWFLFIPVCSFPTTEVYNTVFTNAYGLGARIHSNSWGDPNSGNTYGPLAQQTDDFVFDHPEFLVLWAAGNNDGRCNTNTKNSKNAVIVGASGNTPNQEDVHTISCPGPTGDVRLIPTVMTPTDVTAAQAGTINGYIEFDGTSASTPVVAGVAALVREYFVDGWYPTGERNPDNGFVPSAALLKASLIASTVEMSGANSHANDYDPPGPIPAMDYPNNNQGWGRIRLEDALYFDGDARRLFVVDERRGLVTGETVEYAIDVSDLNMPLKAVLVWTDPPAGQGCNPCQMNNLDLEVVDPNGLVLRGNNFAGQNPGETVFGGFADLTNTEEVVYRVTGPTRGTWRIRITATDVDPAFSATQPFALVVTGPLTKEMRVTTTVATAGSLTAASDASGSTHLAWLETGAGTDMEVWHARIDAQGRVVAVNQVTDASDDVIGDDQYGPQIVFAAGSLYVFFANPCQITGSSIIYCLDGKRSTDLGATWSDFPTPSSSVFESYGTPPRALYDRSNPLFVDVDSGGRLHMAFKYVSNAMGITYEQVRYARYEGGWSTPYTVWADSYPTPTGSQIDRIRWPKTAKGQGTVVHVLFSYDPAPQSSSGNTYVKYTRSSVDGFGGWGTPVDLDVTTDWARENTLEADETRGWVHASWNDWTANAFDLFYSRNENNGAGSWTTPIEIGVTAGDQVYPALLLDASGFLHLAYADSNTGNREAVYIASPDQGVNWNLASRLSRAAGNALIPAIAVNSRLELDYAWVDDRDGNREVYYYSLYPERRVTHQTEDSYNPSVTVGVFQWTHVAWMDERNGDPDIYYARYDTEGRQTAFKELTTSADEAVANDQFGVIITSWRSDLFVFFANPCQITTYTIIYCVAAKRSSDFGETWTSMTTPGYVYEATGIPPTPATPISDRADPIHVDSTSSYVYLIWLEVTDQVSMKFERVMYARFDGTAWSAAYQVYSDSYVPLPYPTNTRIRWPRVSRGSDLWVHATFSYDQSPEAAGGPTYVRYTRSPLEGFGGWESTQDVGITRDYAREASLQADDQSDSVYVTWHDWVPGNSFDVLFKRSQNDGDTWPPSADVLATGAGWQRWPALALDRAGYLHVVYTDNTAGNDELVLRSSTTGRQPTMTWGAPRQLTTPIAGVPGTRRTPDVATSLPPYYNSYSGFLIVAWWDTWGSSLRWNEVYWMRVL